MLCALNFTMFSCVDNNNANKGIDQAGESQESDYEEQAPTYNKTRDDIEASNDSIASGQKNQSSPAGDNQQ